MYLKVKLCEIQTLAAQQHLLSRIQLEEAMIGTTVSLDPLPSFYKFANGLDACPRSRELLTILQKLKMASQYETRRMVGNCLAKHMPLMETVDELSTMINKHGWGEVPSAKPELVLEMMRAKNELTPSSVQQYARLPYVKCADVLELMPKITGDSCTRFEQILVPLYEKLTADEKVLAAKVICDRLKLIAQDNSGLRRLEALPRKIVGDKVIITLPTPERNTFEELMQGWRN